MSTTPSSSNSAISRAGELAGVRDGARAVPALGVTLAADASSRPALRDALAALRRRGVDVSAEPMVVSRRAAALAVLPLAVGMVLYYLALLLA